MNTTAVSRTEFDVCLVAVTNAITLAELTTRVGSEPSDGSHSIGDPHVLKSKGAWQSTVWQVCSDLPRTASLGEHFDAIARKVSSSRLRAPGVLPNETRVYFSIGVFSDAQIPVADLSRSVLGQCEEYQASIEVRFYSPEME